MKINALAGATLALLAVVSMGYAQRPAPAVPYASVNQPTTNYDYHETFGTLFYEKNGNEYRAADGEPAVVCMSHETACLSPPLPWTMGEILLSLMPMEIFPPGNEGAGKAEPQPSLFKRMRGRVFV